MTTKTWQSCLEHLHDLLEVNDFNNYIATLDDYQQGSLLVISAPNMEVYNYIDEHLLAAIIQVLRMVSPNSELQLTCEQANCLLASSLNNNKDQQIPSKDKRTLEKIWKKCLDCLQEENSPQEFNLWLRPLQVNSYNDSQGLILLAPNRFVVDWVQKNFYLRIEQLVNTFSHPEKIKVKLVVGSTSSTCQDSASSNVNNSNKPNSAKMSQKIASNLNPAFTFSTFVEGKSNSFARAAFFESAKNPGRIEYNPLVVYGKSGLGKTHLGHAAGNKIKEDNPDAVVLYLHSERFVAHMIKSIQTNAIEDFKNFYRGANVVIIDDAQFFAGKERSQEELFHTINELMDQQKQIILTIDSHPKELEGLHERLRSRFGSGLTVGVEPPDLETRIAILMNKAKQSQVILPYEVALFISENIKSNVRELEGALKRVIANAYFMAEEISLPFAQKALKDIISLQSRLITVDNIQKIVAKYYNIKVADLVSKRRTRSITEPRHIAIALAKELTNHSLPEIGDYFGGRDHTTVLHACRKVQDLLGFDAKFKEDFDNLMRILSN